MSSSEYDLLKDVPGYRAILKAVLKSQIQNLVEQLSQETEEETVILSASTADGTLSHLGSLHGKDFLHDRDEIKFQFLNHCLKKKHTAIAQELDHGEKESHSSRKHNFSASELNFEGVQASETEVTPDVWQQTSDVISINPLQNRDVSIDDNLPKSDEDYSGGNPEFSETLTVNGEKLVVQTSPVKRKRKRKPSYIPNSQRRRASETSVKIETDDNSFLEAAEPSCISNDEADQTTVIDVTDDNIPIKDEPVDEDYLEENKSLPADDTSVTTDMAFQYDNPLSEQEQAVFPPFGGGRGGYTCMQCGMVYKCASGLHYHMKIHNRNLQACNQCGYKCVRKTQLLAHIFKHHDPTGAPFCYICRKSFSRTDKLTEHNKRFHRGKVNNAWKQVAVTLPQQYQ